ncbi:restriction endonuclease subunit S [Enterococcus cecorum]|uniref:restriction endonuclease subunit S n=1 Tax=Enterococcus cecorum TaxID=44008 RepID=UPI0023B7D060|nr:restriction endonuclease subunit S [Enterococcus cecorum]
MARVWEQRKLGETVENLKSGLSRMLSNEDIGIPVIRANNLVFGRVNFNDDIKYWYLQDPKGADTSNYLVHKGDILINFINSESKMGTASYVDAEPIRPTIYTTNILKLSVNNKYYSKFIFYITYTKRYINYVKSITKPAVNQASFTTVEYKKFSLSIPKYEEQKRIGQFFEKLDKLITLHQRKLEQLEQLKNTLLSKMFPKSETNIPEIRFSGFTDTWKQRKLGEMSTSFSGGTPTVGVREYYNGEIPFIRSAEIGKCKTELYISKLGLDNSSARLVSKGDILYAMYGATSGEVARAQIDGAINQAILVIKPVQSVDSEYITQWLRKNKQKIIKTFLQGGQGNLSASIIKNLKVYFPTIEEQQKIGNVFNSFDRSLKFHLNRINELKCLKNNLLNKMFI